MEQKAAALATLETAHEKDADCTVDLETLCCSVCGVDHSRECPDCGRRGFHSDTCFLWDPPALAEVTTTSQLFGLIYYQNSLGENIMVVSCKTEKEYEVEKRAAWDWMENEITMVTVRGVPSLGRTADSEDAVECAGGCSVIRHYVSFINPRTRKREQIWFRTRRLRMDFIADLAQDFGSIATEEWDTPEPTVDAVESAGGVL